MDDPGSSDQTSAARSDGSVFPPAGWIRREDAARAFGIPVSRFKSWCMSGRVTCGKVVAKPGRGWCKIYPLDEIQRLRAQFDAERGRLPEGLVSLDDVRKHFGTSRTHWKRWQRSGLVPSGQWVQKTGLRTKVKAYTAEEIARIAEAFDKIGKPYVDPERPGVVRVPVMSFRVTVCEALIDAADLPRIEGKRWNWMTRGDGAMPAVVEASEEGKPLKHILLGRSTSDWNIAHANADPLDCRRENLIVRTFSETNGAKRKSATYYGVPTSSRFKGVTWDKARGCWYATVKHAETRRFLGRFDDEIAAAQAYDEAALELFGEHARINFPDGVDVWIEKNNEERDEARGGERIAA